MEMAPNLVIVNFQANGIMKKLIRYFSEKQQALFVIDSIGAFMTAFSLFVIVPQFMVHFGMPEKQLTFLSAIAACFGIYSAACFLFLKGSLTPYIRFIGMANLLYCALTIGLLIGYYPMMTTIGITYFVMEIVIICALSYLEFQVTTSNDVKQLT